MVRQESAKLSFVGSIPTRASSVLLALLLTASLHAAADPATLLQQAVTAKEELFPRIRDYFGREDIRYFREDKPGRRKQTQWLTFDVQFTDRKVSYRLVARNGKPVRPRPPLPAGTDAPGGHDSRRFGMHPADLLHDHELTLRGAETVLGRPCWVIEAKLLASAPDNVSPDAGMSAADAEIWIDQETHWILAEHMTFRRYWNRITPGATIDRRYLFHEGLPLVDLVRIRGRLPNGRRMVETEQRYSGYQRFAAESSIQFEPSPR